MQDLYPTEITPAEAQAGFRQVEIDNLNGDRVGHPATVRAVVYPVDASHRLVKMAHPGRAGHYYALQMFGRYSFDPTSRPGKWLPRYANYEAVDPVALTLGVASWLAAHQDNRYVAVDPLLEPAGKAD